MTDTIVYVRIIMQVMKHDKETKGIVGWYHWHVFTEEMEDVSKNP